ncbi:MAG: repressor LexA [Promethearchaeota archaeon Loki_b32]|nr:MAG: repressor LexA [Candidatus Lokiarchaeota archaeon Loki_b32]
MLTKKQKHIFDYLKKFIEKKGYSPSLEEIKKHFRLSSVATIHKHLENLKNKGYLEKLKNQPRSIKISKNKKSQELIQIPILGTISAGQPIEAIETPNETITITQNRLGKSGNHYALRVEGDSMIEEGIFNGDIVVIKKQSVAENGQTVVAIIDDNQATLKKIYMEKDRFKLKPANQTMLPIYRKEVEIRGVVIKIIRNLEDSSTTQRHSTLDLFAGIGGIRMGFKKNGFKTAFANDINKQCKKTYDANFKKSKLIVEDIKKLGINDLPKFDFLLAGFPCQAFSIAGYREGFNDKKGRGNLFFDIIKILKARKPKGFLLENVKNLKGHDDGKTFKIIRETLGNLGYHIKEKTLNSMHYGNVPQNRERIYILGFRNKKFTEKFNFPEKIPLTKTIEDMLEKNIDKKYYYNDKPLFKKLKEYKFLKNKVYQWRRQYIRENKKGVCPTLTANMGTGGHNVPIIKDSKGVRKLTPRECLRLQGFPDNFKLPSNLPDSALYKQIGNSVTVTVIERIARAINKAIN